MTPLALVFMVTSWSLVLGLTVWAYARVLGRGERRTGSGPDEEPDRGHPPTTTGQST